ncbi:MAG: hypothetical protein ACKOJI_07595 [Phycisphaerales bacterium]
MTSARPVDGGTCHVFRAFEAGVAVDLDRAATAVRGARRTGLQPRDGQPMPADFAPQPVTFTVEATPVACSAVRSSGIAHVTVCDFGALSVRLDLPLAGSADVLPALARALVGAELQIDAAALYESVDNALKLFGDQWVARLHQAATRRMHIEDYERSVLRKIATLESVYGKVRDRQVQVRAELLEWIIIVLIAFEVVRSLWP